MNGKYFKATVIGTHSGGMEGGDRIIAVLNDYPDVYVRVEFRTWTSDGYIAVERECRALDKVKPYVGSEEIEFRVSDEYLPAFEAVIKGKTRSDLIADTDQGIGFP